MSAPPKLTFSKGCQPRILACLPKGLSPATFIEMVYEPEMLTLERGVKFRGEKLLIGCVGATGNLIFVLLLPYYPHDPFFFFL